MTRSGTESGWLKRKGRGEAATVWGKGWRKSRGVLAVVVCLLFAGLVLGRPAELVAEIEPWAQRETVEEAAIAETSADARGIDGVRERPPAVQMVSDDVRDEFWRLWELARGENGRPGDFEAERRQGVLSELTLWDETARVGATYDVIDLDRLRDVVGRRDEPGARRTELGVFGEVSIGSVGSIRVGYALREQPSDAGVRLFGVADAEVAYNLGERTRIGADVERGVGQGGVEQSAGVDVSYAVAPNTSVRAGYRLLSFEDAHGTQEYRQSLAAAGMQFRF